MRRRGKRPCFFISRASSRISASILGSVLGFITVNAAALVVAPRPCAAAEAPPPLPRSSLFPPRPPRPPPLITEV